MIHIKCDLCFCDKWDEYNIPDEKLNNGPNPSSINFNVYIYQVICATHGIVPNVRSVCRICEENDDIKNGILNNPTYGKNKYIKNIYYVLSVNFTWYIINQC